MSSVGKRIKQARLDCGLSQLELANLCGWSDGQTRVSGYENDRREPGFHELQLIAGVLKCNPAWLAFGAEGERTGSNSNEQIEIASNYADSGTFGAPSTKSSRIPIGNIASQGREPFFVDADFLSQAGLKASGVVWDEVSDNSMDPVLPEGTKVILRTDESSIKAGRPYLVEQGGLRRVRLLYQLPNGQIRLSGYNRTEWPDEVVEENDLVVRGRVISWTVVTL